METTNKKQKTLANFLEVEVKDLQLSTYDNSIFELGEKEYLVFTDKEASARAKEYILDSIWAFNTWFIQDHAIEGVSEEAIKKMQELCEDGNEPLKALIQDKNAFVENAINTDGQGHFLATYDGTEEHINGFYIYRIN